MCTVKSYNDSIHSYLDAVLLRIDTYLLPDDYDKYTILLKDLSNGIPSKIQFNEINEQLIDIDSVAELHNTYINRILMSDLTLLSKANLNNIDCDIYVNPYFIAFYIPSKSIKIEKAIGAIKEIFLSKYEMPLDFGYLRLNYSVNKKTENDIWNICDRSAFPVLKEIGYNGQYTDSMKYDDDVYLDLSRTISPSDVDSNLLDINIQSKAVFPVSAMKGVADKIMNVIELSKNEITRCFNS